MFPIVLWSTLHRRVQFMAALYKYDQIVIGAGASLRITFSFVKSRNEKESG